MSLKTICEVASWPQQGDFKQLKTTSFTNVVWRVLGADRIFED